MVQALFVRTISIPQSIHNYIFSLQHLPHCSWYSLAVSPSRILLGKQLKTLTQLLLLAGLSIEEKKKNQCVAVKTLNPLLSHKHNPGTPAHESQVSCCGGRVAGDRKREKYLCDLVSLGLRGRLVMWHCLLRHYGFLLRVGSGPTVGLGFLRVGGQNINPGEGGKGGQGCFLSYVLKTKYEIRH